MANQNEKRELFQLVFEIANQLEKESELWLTEQGYAPLHDAEIDR